MNILDDRILADAELIWKYHHIGRDEEGYYDNDSAAGHRPEAWKADLILGFGSHDLRVAERCAELYMAGAAGVILFTGGWGRITGSLWREPEAAIFRRAAEQAGVPAAAILTEELASNTGENIRFSRSLAGADEKKLRILAVDKPARERRTLAALRRQWPEADVRITSPQCSFGECLAFYEQGAGGTGLTVRRFITMMLGDLIKMEDYAKRGFQIPQSIPEEVKQACRRLQENGFTPE